ncbi:MAG: family 1 glycosylhydrolase [Patescibacteria group bacterium]
MRKILLTAILILSALYWSSSLKKTPKEASPTMRPIESEKSAEQTSDPVVLKDIVFPEKFFFGTAYSDFQTAGLAPASDWASEWEKIADLLEKDSLAKKKLERKATHPGTANDLFNRYKEDFDLASQVGIQIHRISLDWARIEPEEGKWDWQTVKKWREIFSYMKAKGIEPMICLNHFPNPKWFADLGGWENNKSEYYYQRYAEFVAENIGASLKIKWWLTFNEPQFLIIVPYGNGTWPPFKGVDNFQDKNGFARMMHVASNILDGHRLAYRAIHKVMDGKLPKEKVMVSFASAPGAFYPYDESSSLDKLADNIFNVIYTLSFDSFVGNVDRDFIGLNYYGRTKLKFHISLWNTAKYYTWLTSEKPFAVEWVGPDESPQGDRPREFYPRGLYDLIMKFKDYGLPLVITENGLNDASDKHREEFIVIHLKAIHDAIRDGADVIGYQYWSLTDTWEPGEAFFSAFGLIEIDRTNNLQRKLRPSSLTYSEIIKTRIVRNGLLEKHREFLSQ